jgi:hypothetical protein
MVVGLVVFHRSFLRFERVCPNEEHVLSHIDSFWATQNHSNGK